MKRAKLMLSSILVVAVVAGALAFKAKSPNVCVYTLIDTNAPVETLCELAAIGVTTKTTATADLVHFATTIPNDGACPQRTTCITKWTAAE